MARLELRGISKTYRGGIAAAQGVDLAFDGGELGVIVGPSGSGKSTLLRLIAGLETPDSGTVHLGDRRIDALPPRDRGLAMVFQDAVVYPHLDVFENIAFGLRARRVARDEIRERVEATAGMLDLGGSLRRASTTLSGGQKRRVTLARALVLRPELLLLDEPFAGLDAPLRASIRAEIADLHRHSGATMILVTHDQAEALALADRLAVVHAGQVEQVGRPLDLYRRPRNVFVARFLGQPPMSLIPCTVAGAGPDSLRVEPTGIVPLDPWTVAARSPLGTFLAGWVGKALTLGLRAEQVMVGPPEPGWPRGEATVDRLEPAGHEVGAFLRLGPHPIAARLPAKSSVRVGDTVAVALDLEAACWFDLDTGDRVVGRRSGAED